MYRGFIKTQREANPRTYRSVPLLSRGSRCMVDSFPGEEGFRGAPPCHFCAAHLKQFKRQIKVDFTVCTAFFMTEELNRKQHYNCFSEECWLIYIFFCLYDSKKVCVYVCVYPNAPSLKYGVFSPSKKTRLTF